MRVFLVFLFSFSFLFFLQLLYLSGSGSCRCGSRVRKTQMQCRRFRLLSLFLLQGCAKDGRRRPHREFHQWRRRRGRRENDGGSAEGCFATVALLDDGCRSTASNKRAFKWHLQTHNRMLPKEQSAPGSR